MLYSPYALFCGSGFNILLWQKHSNSEMACGKGKAVLPSTEHLSAIWGLLSCYFIKLTLPKISRTL